MGPPPKKCMNNSAFLYRGSQSYFMYIKEIGYYVWEKKYKVLKSISNKYEVLLFSLEEIKINRTFFLASS